MKKFLVFCICVLISATVFTACGKDSTEAETPSGTDKISADPVENGTNVPTDEGSSSPTDGTSEIHTHTFGEWKIIQALDCVHDEIRARSCACGEIDSEISQKAVGICEYDEFGYCTGCKSRVSVGLEYTLASDGQTYVLSGMGSCTDTELIIPDRYKGKTVSAIESDAFDGSEIQSVVIPNGVISLEKEMFKKCASLVSVTLGAGVQNATEALLDAVSIKEITVSEENEVYSSLDGVLFSADKKTLWVYPTSKGSVMYEVPDGVVAIEKQAFANNRAISKVFFPKTLKIIGNKSFNACKNLSSAELPDGLSVIRADAFSECSNLEYISIPNSVEVIAQSAFRLCNLKKVDIGEGVKEIGEFAFFKNENLAIITLPDSVRSIGMYAFGQCVSLSSITLPEALESMDIGAFYCCEALQTIHFEGTKEQWDKVDKKNGWDELAGVFEVNFAKQAE